MNYDVFLSHSSADRIVVDRVRDELKTLGYSVFVDYEALPEISPDEVTRDTANALQDAMRQCSSLVYVLTANATTSHWMPWELGFFDGFTGRVFIWPVDSKAKSDARDCRYVSLYPVVPFKGRKDFVARHLPQERMSPTSVRCPPPAFKEHAPAEPPLIDYANKMMTGKFAQELPGMLADPTRAVQTMSEIGEAWWRLWGLLPPPRRPGDKP